MEHNSDNRNPDDFDEGGMTFSGAPVLYGVLFSLVWIAVLSLYRLVRS
jgi:hypothetical protein